MVFPAYRSPLKAPVEHDGTTHSSGPLSGAHKHLGACTAPLAEYALSTPQPYFLGTRFVCNRGWYHRVGQLQAALRRASGTEGAGGQCAISLNRRLPRSLSPCFSQALEENSPVIKNRDMGGGHRGCADPQASGASVPGCQTDSQRPLGKQGEGARGAPSQLRFWLLGDRWRGPH